MLTLEEDAEVAEEEGAEAPPRLVRQVARQLVLRPVVRLLAARQALQEPELLAEPDAVARPQPEPREVAVVAVAADVQSSSLA